MAEGKNSFVLYLDQKEVFEALSDEQAGQLIKHIFRYVADEEPTADDPIVKAVFIGIKQTLKRDLKKWETKQEQRRQAGLESARRRKEAAKLAQQKNKKERTSTVDDKRQHPSTVSVSVSGNGNVNGNGSEKEREDIRALEFLKTEFQERFQTDFQMKYAKQIQDKKKFAEDFNDTVDLEDLEFTAKKLFPRLAKYARNWIDNQKKYSKTPEPNSYESGKLPRF